MPTRKTWADFRDAKLFWWVNRMLHLFGWAIAFEEGEDGAILDVYPQRVDYRGFDAATEEAGFVGLTQHLQENAERLRAEVEEG